MLFYCKIIGYRRICISEMIQKMIKYLYISKIKMQILITYQNPHGTLIVLHDPNLSVEKILNRLKTSVSTQDTIQ